MFDVAEEASWETCLETVIIQFLLETRKKSLT